MLSIDRSILTGQLKNTNQQTVKSSGDILQGNNFAVEVRVL